MSDSSKTRGKPLGTIRWCSSPALPSAESEYPVGSKWRVTKTGGTWDLQEGDIASVYSDWVGPPPVTSVVCTVEGREGLYNMEPASEWLAPFDPEPEAPAACSCTIPHLMLAGCTCGAITPFQREIFLRNRII